MSKKSTIFIFIVCLSRLGFTKGVRVRLNLSKKSYAIYLLVREFQSNSVISQSDRDSDWPLRHLMNIPAVQDISSPSSC